MLYGKTTLQAFSNLYDPESGIYSKLKCIKCVRRAYFASGMLTAFPRPSARLGRKQGSGKTEGEGDLTLRIPAKMQKLNLRSRVSTYYIVLTYDILKFTPIKYCQAQV